MSEQAQAQPATQPAGVKQSDQTLALNLRVLDKWCRSRRGRTMVLSIDWVESHREFVCELDAANDLASMDCGPIWGRDLDEVLCKAAVRASELMALDRM